MSLIKKYFKGFYKEQLQTAKDAVRKLQGTTKAVINGSGMGTGKTETSFLILATMNLKPFIISTVATQPHWKRVAKMFGVEGAIFKTWGQFSRGGDHIKVPAGYGIVGDEMKFSGLDCKAGLFLANLAQSFHVIINSATPTVRMEDCRGLFAILKICPWEQFLRRAKDFGMNWREMGQGKGYFQWQHTPANRAQLTRLLDQHIVGCSFEEMHGTEVKNISTVSVPVANRRAFNEAYDSIKRWDKRAESTAQRQFCELAKVPAMAEMALTAQENGKSTIGFFNFSASLDEFLKRTDSKLQIRGSQSAEDRQGCIDRFQESTAPAIIGCNIQAGAEGINLHDLNGFQRLVLLCPSYRAKDFLQATGRAHRTNQLSTPAQKMVFAAGTKEDAVLANISRKLTTLEAVTDADFLNFTEEKE